MKRILIILLTIIIILSFILSIGCAEREIAPYHIDRQITSQATTIDNRGGDYSTLYFANGLEVIVTNATLYEWLTRNMFINVWTYKFQETCFQNRYDLIGINDTFLEGFNQPE